MVRKRRQAQFRKTVPDLWIRETAERKYSTFVQMLICFATCVNLVDVWVWIIFAKFLPRWWFFFLIYWYECAPADVSSVSFEYIQYIYAAFYMQSTVCALYMHSIVDSLIDSDTELHLVEKAGFLTRLGLRDCTNDESSVNSDWQTVMVVMVMMMVIIVMMLVMLVMMVMMLVITIDD